MVDCILLLITLTGMIGLGMFFLDLFKKFKVTIAEKIILSYGVGFGLIGYVFFILGMSYNINSFLSWIILIALSILTIFVFRANKIKPTYNWLTSIRNLGKIKKVIILMAFCILLLVFLNQFSLYVGWDSIRGYLRIANIFSVNGNIIHLLEVDGHTGNYISWTHVPLLSHMVYAFCFLLKGSILARLIHFSTIIFLVLAIYIFSKRFFDKTIAFYSTIAFFTLTGVVNWASEVRVDFPLVFMCVLSYFTLLRYYKDKDGGWLYLGAIFFGFACSIKINAIIPLLIVLWILIVEAKVKLKPIILFSSIIVIIAVPFYIRGYVLMGNPFWPYFNDYFPNAKLPIDTTTFQINKSLFSLSFLSLKSFFLDLGRSSLLLSYLPVIFFIKKERHRNLKILFYCFISCAVVYVLPRSFRHSMFAWPLLCLLIGLAMSKVEKKWDFHVIVNETVILIALLFSLAQVSIHSIEYLPSVVGIESKDHFFSRVPALDAKFIYRKTGHIPYSNKIKYSFSKEHWMSKYYTEYYNIELRDPEYYLNEEEYLIADKKVNDANLEFLDVYDIGGPLNEYYIHKKINH